MLTSPPRLRQGLRGDSEPQPAPLPGGEGGWHFWTSRQRGQEMTPPETAALKPSGGAWSYPASLSVSGACALPLPPTPPPVSAGAGSHSSPQPVRAAWMCVCVCAPLLCTVKNTQPMCSVWMLMILCVAWISASRQDVQHTTWPFLFFSFWPIL